jgi:hypothetical protein
MQMNATIDCQSELSAVLIRADGSHFDIGVLKNSFHESKFNKLHRRMHRLLARMLGPVAALLMLANLIKTGHASLIPMFGIVTTAGVNYMASDFASNGVTPTISGFKFQDSGTGTNGAVVGDTALQTPTGIARVQGTPTNPSANQYRSVATIAYNNTFAVTEWGIFSASTTGTLWDRRTFAAINVVSGDSIQFTWTLTVNSGGT